MLYIFKDDKEKERAREILRKVQGTTVSYADSDVRWIIHKLTTVRNNCAISMLRGVYKADEEYLLAMSELNNQDGVRSIDFSKNNDAGAKSVSIPTSFVEGLMHRKEDIRIKHSNEMERLDVYFRINEFLIDVLSHMFENCGLDKEQEETFRNAQLLLFNKEYKSIQEMFLDVPNECSYFYSNEKTFKNLSRYHSKKSVIKFLKLSDEDIRMIVNTKYPKNKLLNKDKGIYKTYFPLVNDKNFDAGILNTTFWKIISESGSGSIKALDAEKGLRTSTALGIFYGYE